MLVLALVKPLLWIDEGFKLMLEGSTLLGDTKEHKICLVFQFGTPSLLA